MRRILTDDNRVLKTLIYIYIYAILFDGVLRKWVIPMFSTPIMMIKQVVAVLIFLFGIKYWNKMKTLEQSFFFIGVCVFITTMLFGHQNFIVAIYGCLPYWFGLPVCFIIGKSFNYHDLIKIGKILVYTSILNSVLLILQFNLPVTHILNYQSGEIDAGIIGYSISSLQGGFRPSGLFVHNTQNGLFQILSLSYILYFLFFAQKSINKNILIIALVLDIVSLPFSVSRTNIFYQFGVLLFFACFCANREQWWRFFQFLPLLIIAFFLLRQVPFVNTAINTLFARFDDASRSQFSGVSTTTGTLMDLYNRNIVYNLKAIFQPQTFDGERAPFWGFGQGMSTQVGGRLLNLKANAGFALAEWDGLRIMCESGYIFGWLIIYIRLAYSFRFLFRIRDMQHKHKYLSLIFLPSFLVSFYLLNNWGNLFLSNFAFMVGGLFLASYRYRMERVLSVKSVPTSGGELNPEPPALQS